MQAGPVDGQTETVRRIIPVKPYCPVSVIEELPYSADSVVIAPGLSPTEKSRTFTFTLAVWDRELLNPTTVTVKLAAVVPVQERVEF